MVQSPCFYLYSLRFEMKDERVWRSICSFKFSGNFDIFYNYQYFSALDGPICIKLVTKLKSFLCFRWSLEDLWSIWRPKFLGGFQRRWKKIIVTPYSDRIEICKTFITPQLLVKKSSNFLWMLVIYDSFTMQDLRSQFSKILGQHNTE